MYFIERDPATGDASIDFVSSTDEARSWSAVHRIRLPRRVSRSLTRLTNAAVGKSTDMTNPIGLIGGFDTALGEYELIAFVIAP